MIIILELGTKFYNTRRADHLRDACQQPRAAGGECAGGRGRVPCLLALALPLKLEAAHCLGVCPRGHLPRHVEALLAAEADPNARDDEGSAREDCSQN